MMKCTEIINENIKGRGAVEVTFTGERAEAARIKLVLDDDFADCKSVCEIGEVEGEISVTYFLAHEETEYFMHLYNEAVKVA